MHVAGFPQLSFENSFYSASSSLLLLRPLTCFHPRYPMNSTYNHRDPLGLDIPSDYDGTGDSDKKLEWLRSQIIGGDAEFQTPFGRRRITYSDLIASGRFLQVVEDYIINQVLPYYGNTHTSDSYVGYHTTQLMDHATHYVKRSLGGGSTDILLFCGSGCTAAIKRLQEVTGIAAPPTLRSQLLACIPDSERWVVFIGPYEHHSNLLSWRQSLAEVVEIGLDAATGQIDVEQLECALSAPEFAGRPKLGSFSACSNITGVKTDTRAIAKMLHSYGAYACFDFACSGPYVDVDIRPTTITTTMAVRNDEHTISDDDRYDAIFLSPHKFMGGPGTPGILLMTEKLYKLKGTPPSTSGGGTVLFVSGYPDVETLYCEHPEEREDAGTPAIVQKIRAALAFRVKEYLNGPDSDFIHRREEELTNKVLVRLSANPKIDVLGLIYDDDELNRGQYNPPRLPIISFLVYPTAEHRADLTNHHQHPHLHCRLIVKLLNDLFGVQARGGCACAGPYSHCLLSISHAKSCVVRSAVQNGYVGLRPGFARVSFAYYATDKETDFVLDAVEFVAKYGDRFLSLYDFDWKSGDWTCRHSFSFTDSVSADGANIYEMYLGAATHFAEALPPYRKQVSQIAMPDDVDHELVTFMI